LPTPCVSCPRVTKGLFRLEAEPQISPLRCPGFPVEFGGVGDLHAAFLNESRTRGHVQRCVAGNPGFAPVEMTILIEDRIQRFQKGPLNCRSLGFARDDKGKGSGFLERGCWTEAFSLPWVGHRPMATPVGMTISLSGNHSVFLERETDGSTTKTVIPNRRGHGPAAHPRELKTPRSGIHSLWNRYPFLVIPTEAEGPAVPADASWRCFSTEHSVVEGSAVLSGSSWHPPTHD
jgi:hypothetical protein